VTQAILHDAQSTISFEYFDAGHGVALRNQKLYSRVQSTCGSEASKGIGKDPSDFRKDSFESPLGLLWRSRMVELADS